MKDKSKKWDRAFFDRIREILLSEWDPIGFGALLPSDEYDSYAMQVYSQLVAGSSADQIASYLADNEFSAMGLGTEPPPIDRLRPIAEHLVVEWEKFKRSKGL